MNAAVLVDGYAEGGATGARARLERFWKSVSVLSARTLDSFPHNGAVVTFLSVCGVSHREGYFDLFMVAIVGALIAARGSYPARIRVWFLLAALALTPLICPRGLPFREAL